jgi:hypothetical protein
MDKELSPLQKELLERADTIFKTIAETVKTGVDFAKEQLPDIAYQYIMMERVYLTCVIIGTLIAMGLASWLFIVGVVKNKWQLYDPFLIMIPVLALIAAGVAPFLINFKDFVMVWFAPKIYLITHIIQLVKG